MTDLLEIRDLQAHFFTIDGVTRAVDGVSISARKGEVVGIVGESGCGKSVTALSVLQLLPTRIAKIVGGEILFEGRNLLDLSENEMCKVRGNQIAMIFQEPMTSLNPVHTIGQQIAEAVQTHSGGSARAARARALEMLKLVRMSDPESRLDEYPHQLSGGMRQRAMIAMALACRPKLLIADEPTTALDATIQAQILRLMLDLKSEIGASVLLITHDMGVVAETCDRVIVMYAGRKVEEASVQKLFASPAHPYTRALMASRPHGDDGTEGGRLTELPGLVPSLREEIIGCTFAPRCAFATERCRREAPEGREIGTEQFVACHEAERILASSEAVI